MTTYNGAAYVRAQLDSIAAQSRQPDEIVIGDDQSGDETLDILHEFAAQVRLPVHVKRNPERLGYARNFERVIARCQGDIIALSDQDDIWRGDKLEKIETAFAEHPAAAYVFSNGLLIDEAGSQVSGSLWDGALFTSKEQALYNSGQALEVLLRHNVVTGAAMAFRSAIARGAFPIASGWVHDYWLVCVLEGFGRGLALNDPLISYRQHPNQAIGLFKYSLAYAAKAVERHDERHCAREADNFVSLAEHLQRIGAPDRFVASIREKAIFYQRRADMRRHPFNAPKEMFSNWSAGNYRRFSPGIKFLLLDAASVAVSMSRLLAKSRGDHR